MKKTFSLALYLCTIMIAISSCSGAKSDNPLIGKWEQTVAENGVKNVVIYEFAENGELEQTMTVTSDMINIEASGTCEYTYENNTITFQFSAENFDYSKFEIEGIEEDVIQDVLEQTKASIVNVTQTLENVVISGDTLTATFGFRPITLIRR